MTHVFRGQAQAAVTRAEEAFSFVLNTDLRNFFGFVRSILGDTHAAEGRLEEGIAEIVQSLAELKSTSWDYPSFVLEELARAYLAAGKPNQALHTAEEGLQMIARTGEFAFRPPLFAWKAKALISLGETERALHWLRAAMDLAHEQSAKLVELGATFLQASVLASQDQREQGREMLAEVYSCFTEGFETVYSEGGEGAAGSTELMAINLSSGACAATPAPKVRALCASLSRLDPSSNRGEDFGRTPILQPAHFPNVAGAELRRHLFKDGSYRSQRFGELVVLYDDGRSNFAKPAHGQTGTHYYVFDLLWLSNTDLRTSPL